MTKIAAYQAPLLPIGSREAIGLIRERVAECEKEGVEILCCPEAVFGGLADYASDPRAFALSANQLADQLAPFASETVATIVGFTEITDTGQLYNSAAVAYRGAVIGVYRKQHPAIRKSVYAAGDRMPVFKIGELTFGIVICNDSNFAEPAKSAATQGASVLFVPTNNALRTDKADVVAAARATDVRRATENRLVVVRADVAGHVGPLTSYGSSAIVDPTGRVLVEARSLNADLLIAEVANRPNRADGS